jgi:hypothetical protein
MKLRIRVAYNYRQAKTHYPRALYDNRQLATHNRRPTTASSRFC